MQTYDVMMPSDGVDAVSPKCVLTFRIEGSDTKTGQPALGYCIAEEVVEGADFWQVPFQLLSEGIKKVLPAPTAENIEFNIVDDELLSVVVVLPASIGLPKVLDAITTDTGIPVEGRELAREAKAYSKANNVSYEQALLKLTPKQKEE